MGLGPGRHRGVPLRTTHRDNGGRKEAVLLLADVLGQLLERNRSRC